MNIPKTLKIGGHTVAVELVDEIRDGELMGRWDSKKNRILLDKNAPETHLAATLLHEIIHAINIDICETDVEYLSQALYQVLKDNGLRFD